MAHVLCTNLSQATYHSHFADMANIINQKNDYYNLETANKLFIADWLTVFDSFKERVRPYGAVFESINFGNATQASDVINSWVEEKTHEKIKNIVKPDMFSADTTLAIVNAVYFKGTWVNQFEQSFTTQKPFYINKDNSVNVDMMQQINSFNYMENETFRMVELPYKGDRVSMFIMLPQETETLDDVENSLDDTVLEDAVAQLSSSRVDVRLPKFKIETKYDLKGVLKQLGMPTAFDRYKANFSGIADNVDMLISDVIHKAYIETDECGTEAAAATVVIIASCTCMPEKPVLFNADKPFIFFIRDKLTKATIFMGRFNNPNA